VKFVKNIKVNLKIMSEIAFQMRPKVRKYMWVFFTNEIKNYFYSNIWAFNWIFITFYGFLFIAILRDFGGIIKSFSNIYWVQAIFSCFILAYNRIFSYFHENNATIYDRCLATGVSNKLRLIAILCGNTCIFIVNLSVFAIIIFIYHNLSQYMFE
jgi:hypothetical protein